MLILFKNQKYVGTNLNYISNRYLKNRPIYHLNNI